MYAREIIDSIKNEAEHTIAGIISKYSNAEKTIINKNIEKDLRYYLVRPANVNGIEYILCPVPYLFDEETSTEAGFAIDVDQDHFFVYAYTHNHENGEINVVSKLPHCVYRAIRLNGSDYSKISSEIIKTANIDSAKIFIINYLNDIAVGLDSPVEFFDNKLYQQLVNRLYKTGNKKTVKLRLEYLLENYGQGDDYKASVHLANFLFGCGDNIENRGFLKEVNVEKIKPYVQSLYEMLIKEGRINEARELKEWSRIGPNEDVMQKGYEALFKKGWIDKARKLKEWSGIGPNKENLYLYLKKKISRLEELISKDASKEEIVHRGYSALIKYGMIWDILMLYEWSGIEPIFTETAVQESYKALIVDGRIDEARELEKLYGIKPSEDVVQKGYNTLFINGWINEARKLKEWSGIGPSEDVVQIGYEALFINGWINKACELEGWSRIRPNEDVVQFGYEVLFGNGWINDAYELKEWSGIGPNKKNLYLYLKREIRGLEELISKDASKEEIVQKGYEVFLRRGWINEARELRWWSGIEPREDVVQKIYEVLITEGRIWGVLTLYEWSGIKPAFTETAVQRSYEVLFKEGWINEARKLEELSGIKPVFAKFIVQEYYEALFKKGKIDEARKLKKWSGIKPSEDVVQKGYEALFRYGWIDKACELKKWSKIEPNKENIYECFKTQIQGFEEIISIKASKEEIVQKGYKALIENRRIKALEDLIVVTGMMPKENLTEKGCRILIEKHLITQAQRLTNIRGLYESVLEKVLKENRIANESLEKRIIELTKKETEDVYELSKIVMFLKDIYLTESTKRGKEKLKKIMSEISGFKKWLKKGVTNIEEEIKREMNIEENTSLFFVPLSFAYAILSTGIAHDWWSMLCAGILYGIGTTSLAIYAAEKIHNHKMKKKHPLRAYQLKRLKKLKKLL